MSELGDLMPDMSVGKPHKYILYISTVVLLLALFVEAKVYSNKLVVGKAIWLVVWSLLTWFVNSLIQRKIAKLANKSRGQSTITNLITARSVIEGIYLFLVLLTLAG